jgi:hypothetical protein
MADAKPPAISFKEISSKDLAEALFNGGIVSGQHDNSSEMQGLCRNRSEFKFALEKIMSTFPVYGLLAACPTTTPCAIPKNKNGKIKITSIPQQILALNRNIRFCCENR